MGLGPKNRRNKGMGQTGVGGKRGQEEWKAFLGPVRDGCGLGPQRIC